MNFAIWKYIPFAFSVVKTIVAHTKHNYKIKKFDKTREKIDTIEHLIVKLEKKIGECRNEIEELRGQVTFSRTIIIILLIINITLVIFMR